ncbi:MAG TPA: formate/nitrite transporter family protein [Verrucomicrobiae bacterium]|nr:formate/nitrite transporter family protein [Verrucomicrobiae bacterium]
MSLARSRNSGVSEAREKEIQERTSPPGEVVYGAVYREGEHELQRSNRALAWSGLAAGLSMGFSFVAEALLRSRLPDAPWVPIISKLGYAIGFVIVILGRQQLFSKNTLTVILPLLNPKAKTKVVDVARLWALVFFSNILGAFLFALFISHTSVFDSPVRASFAAIAQREFAHTFWSMFLRATLAGWLIALMIWLLPFAETARVGVIALLAYMVGLGEFPHIVAGATPAFYHLLTGEISLAGSVTGFFLPVVLGNIVGGVALVAAGAHAEFHSEHHTQRY